MTSTVPTYALYGEHTQSLVPDSLHCESIPMRSRHYDWEIKPHRHELFMQILYIRSGSADIHFDAREFHVNGPCMLVVPAFFAHGFRFSSNVDGSVVTVVTQHMEHLLAPTPELLGCFGSAQVLHWPAGQPSPAARSLEHLLEEFDTPGPWRLVALETLLRLVLVMLAREVGVRAEQALNARPSRAVQHVQSFKAMLNQCFREQRDIGYYAGHLGITPTQLNRVCRDALGQSALEVVHNRLVMEAKRDLAYSSLSIKEIAIALGFSDPGYFSRFFTRQTQYSPTDFRVLARERLAQDRGAPVRVAADPA